MILIIKEDPIRKYFNALKEKSIYIFSQKLYMQLQ